MVAHYAAKLCWHLAGGPISTSRDCVATKQSVPLARNEKCASRPPDHESFVTGALGNTWRRIKLWTEVGAAIGVPAGVGMNLSVLIAIRVVLWFTFEHRFFRRRLDVLDRHLAVSGNLGMTGRW